MSVSLSGADVDALEVLAGRFKAEASRIRRLKAAISGEVQATGRIWSGYDAAEFRRQWSSTHGPRLGRAADGLEEMARVLGRNAADQAQTSAADQHGGVEAAPVSPALSPGQAGPGQVAHDLLTDGGFLPGEERGAVTDTLYASGLGAMSLGFTSEWITKLLKGSFAPRNSFGRFVSPSSMTVWQRASAARLDRNWKPNQFQAGTVGRWRTAGKWAGRAGTVLTFAGSSWSEWSGSADDPSLSTADRAGRAATVGATTAAGAWGGAWAGAQTGAVIGTAIGGPVGTVVGGFVGGSIGGLLGSYAGEWVGSELKGLGGDLADGVADIVSGIDDVAADFGDALTFWD